MADDAEVALVVRERYDILLELYWVLRGEALSELANCKLQHEVGKEKW